MTFSAFNSHTRSDAASSKSALKVTFNFIQNLGVGGGDMETPPVLRGSPSGTENPYFEEN